LQKEQKWYIKIFRSGERGIVRHGRTEERKGRKPAAANRRGRAGAAETEDTGVGGRQRQTGAGAQGLPKQGAQASGSGRHQALERGAGA